MEISVIILNWNSANDTIACVTSFLGWQVIKPHFFVVDNGSVGNDTVQIAEAYPQSHLLKNEKNLGFADGCNTGIRAALAEFHAAPVLLLNNDATITETAMQMLCDTLAADESVGAVGPLLVDGEHPDILLAAGGINPVLHLHSHRFSAPSSTRPFQVDYVPGTAILIRAETFRQAGLLHPDYFFTMEIADFCRRMEEVGFRSVVVPTVSARHSVQRSDALRKSLYPYYIIRNRFLFLRRHYPRNVVLFGFWAAYSIALAAKTALTGERAVSRAVRLGLLDGLRGRFGNQNARFLGEV